MAASVMASAKTTEGMAGMTGEWAVVAVAAVLRGGTHGRCLRTRRRALRGDNRHHAKGSRQSPAGRQGDRGGADGEPDIGDTVGKAVMTVVSWRDMVLTAHAPVDALAGRLGRYWGVAGQDAATGSPLTAFRAVPRGATPWKTAYTRHPYGRILANHRVLDTGGTHSPAPMKGNENQGIPHQPRGRGADASRDQGAASVAPLPSRRPGPWTLRKMRTKSAPGAGDSIYPSGSACGRRVLLRPTLSSNNACPCAPGSPRRPRIRRLLRPLTYPAVWPTMLTFTMLTARRLIHLIVQGGVLTPRTQPHSYPVSLPDTPGPDSFTWPPMPPGPFPVDWAAHFPGLGGPFQRNTQSSSVAIEHQIQILQVPVWQRPQGKGATGTAVGNAYSARANTRLSVVVVDRFQAMGQGIVP